MARPTKLTDHSRSEICERLAGGESLRSICADDHIPHISNVLQAVVDDRDGFREQYTRAREAAGYAHADKIVEVAYKLEAGDIEPNAARVMLDGFKWAAERQAPKQHSPKQEIDHRSPDGSMTPQRIEIVPGQEIDDDGSDGPDDSTG